MTAYLNVNGEACLEGVLHVPNIGPWWAEVVFQDAPDVSSQVALNIGSTKLVGTIDEGHDGTFGKQRRSRIVAGAGGWGTLVGSQHYHNDGVVDGGGGVRALEVAQDAARLAGESLGGFVPAADVVGVDYVRQSGTASRVLEDVIGGVPWYVDYNGNTIVGTRPSSKVDVDAYQVLGFNPRENLAILSADDLTRIGVGSILSEGLDAPLTVFEAEVRIRVDSSRFVAWGGGSLEERGRLAKAFRTMVGAFNDNKLFGRYRYRVVKMSENRVELQAVAQIVGLPDILPISQKPGVAGAHAKLAGGAIVHVIFVEGDRTMPRVVGYAGKDEQGHAPEELIMSVISLLRLGDETATAFVALANLVKDRIDTLQVAHDTHTHLTAGTGTPSVPQSSIGPLADVAAIKVMAK